MFHCFNVSIFPCSVPVCFQDVSKRRLKKTSYRVTLSLKASKWSPCMLPRQICHIPPPILSVTISMFKTWKSRTCTAHSIQVLYQDIWGPTSEHEMTHIRTLGVLHGTPSEHSGNRIRTSRNLHQNIQGPASEHSGTSIRTFGDPH